MKISFKTTPWTHSSPSKLKDRLQHFAWIFSVIMMFNMITWMAFEHYVIGVINLLLGIPFFFIYLSYNKYSKLLYEKKIKEKKFIDEDKIELIVRNNCGNSDNYFKILSDLGIEV